MRTLARLQNFVNLYKACQGDGCDCLKLSSSHARRASTWEKFTHHAWNSCKPEFGMTAQYVVWRGLKNKEVHKDIYHYMLAGTGSIRTPFCHFNCAQCLMRYPDDIQFVKIVVIWSVKTFWHHFYLHKSNETIEKWLINSTQSLPETHNCMGSHGSACPHTPRICARAPPRCARLSKARKMANLVLT